MSMLGNKTAHPSYLIEINIPSQFKEGSLFVTFRILSSVTGVKGRKRRVIDYLT